MGAFDSDQSVDYSLPESWLAEAATQHRIAGEYRAQAALFQARYYEARDAGTHTPEELQGLALTRAHYIAHAASIERELRDVGAPR